MFVNKYFMLIEEINQKLNLDHQYFENRTQLPCVQTKRLEIDIKYFDMALFSTQSQFVTCASARLRRFPEKPINRYLQPIYFSSPFQAIKIYGQFCNQYIYLIISYTYAIFLPINNTVQHIFNGKTHIFNDTTYLQIFNTFVTLCVTYILG